jgi:hypothetical protein
MNEEQNIPEKSTEAAPDTSKISFGDTTLQSAEEYEKNKDNDKYYEVDKPKKELTTTIGDGEMRNEGTVGMGNIPDDNSMLPEGQTDEQDKAERQDSGN